MSNENSENKVADTVNTVDTQGIEEGTNSENENNYQHYLELGGIINEKDYRSALDRMDNARVIDRENPQVKNFISQVLGMARYAEIELNNSEDVPDPKVALYVILRGDTGPKDVKYHHDQMSDQRVFGEVLRMSGDADSLDKLIKAYPNISFEYKRGK